MLLYGSVTCSAGRSSGCLPRLVWSCPLSASRTGSRAGGHRDHFGPIYHEQFRRTRSGSRREALSGRGLRSVARGRVSARAAGGRRRRRVRGGGRAAALAHPRVWPALAAPVLAYAVVAAAARRAALALAAALVGLAALALFRTCRASTPGWHTIGASIDQLREYLVEQAAAASTCRSPASSGSRCARARRPPTSAGSS